MSRDFLSAEMRRELVTWWLAHPFSNSRLPTWDVASTAVIEGKEGLLLVEAKAHESELHEGGKRLDAAASVKSIENHDAIGRAIDGACAALSSKDDGWNMSRDSHYQLANRFAWAWKIASMGIPVVLVYLGFLEADEMASHSAPFHSKEHWRRVMLAHSRHVVPESCWESRIQTTSAPFFATIRSARFDLVVT